MGNILSNTCGNYWRNQCWNSTRFPGLYSGDFRSTSIPVPSARILGRNAELILTENPEETHASVFESVFGEISGRITKSLHRGISEEPVM